MFWKRVGSWRGPNVLTTLRLSLFPPQLFTTFPRVVEKGKGGAYFLSLGFYGLFFEVFPIRSASNWSDIGELWRWGVVLFTGTAWDCFSFLLPRFGGRGMEDWYYR